jgi:hypothetical protein
MKHVKEKLWGLGHGSRPWVQSPVPYTHKERENKQKIIKPVTSAFKRNEGEGSRLEASLGYLAGLRAEWYIARPCLRKKKKGRG